MDRPSCLPREVVGGASAAAAAAILSPTLQGRGSQEPGLEAISEPEPGPESWLTRGPGGSPEQDRSEAGPHPGGWPLLRGSPAGTPRAGCDTAKQSAPLRAGRGSQGCCWDLSPRPFLPPNQGVEKHERSLFRQDQTGLPWPRLC